MSESSEHTSLIGWLAAMPKAELHLHIDGSLQPLRLLQLADKHGVRLPYGSVAEVEAACDFDDLQSFLDLYYLGASVLRDADDFYGLMADYLAVCREQHIIHCEVMVEPQTYEPQGVTLAVVLEGFQRAMDEARDGWGQSVGLILSFLRHLPEGDALRWLKLAQPYRESFVGIGLASSERDFPPGNFQRLYAEAGRQGYALTAHAGEEGPAAFVGDALDLLGVSRIDHGVRAQEDPALLKRLAAAQVPLTVCPLSNLKLRVVDDLASHPILDLLERGLLVTVNSDDPAYFGGYLMDNFLALEQSVGLKADQALRLVRNGFEAAFVNESARATLLARLDDFLSANPAPGR